MFNLTVHLLVEKNNRRAIGRQQQQQTTTSRTRLGRTKLLIKTQKTLLRIRQKQLTNQSHHIMDPSGNASKGGFNKLFVMLPVMLAARKLDAEDPQTVQYLRIGYGCMQTLCVLVVLYTYMKASSIKASDGSNVVYVPAAPTVRHLVLRHIALRCVVLRCVASRLPAALEGPVNTAKQSMMQW